MFHTPKLKDIEDGIVTAVDSVRSLCSVHMLSGRVYTGVRWLVPIGMDDATPHVDDAVIVHTGLGYPIILGKKPKIEPTYLPQATTGTGGTALPTFSNPSLLGVSANANQTAGFLQKDRFWRSGTSLLGMLRTGSILLKAHTLAQIVISKLDQSIRIVARSYERFSDWGDEIVTNYSGRLYRYIGFNTNFQQAKNGAYLYDQIEGDVAAGEYATTNPFNTTGAAPATTTEIRKKRLKDSQGNYIMVETLATDGSLTLNITAPSGGTQNSVVTQTNSEVSSVVQTTATSGESKVTQQDAQWEVYIQGVTIVVTPSSITSTVGNSVITQTPTSITGTIGGTELNMTGSQGVLSSNGHAVTVTSSGVALT